MYILMLSYFWMVDQLLVLGLTEFVARSDNCLEELTHLLLTNIVILILIEKLMNHN
jgi:hypothetical protein